MRLGVPPGDGECVPELRRRQRRELRRGPALPSPGVVHRREGVGRGHALQLLLVGRELEIRALSVGSERYVNARHLERRAVEMRGFRRAFERQREPPQIVTRRHYFSASVFRFARPVSKSLPIILSRSMKTHITFEISGIGPCMSHETCVAPPFGCNLYSTVLLASNGRTKSSLSVTDCAGAASTISMRPAPALLSPSHS